jgi:hypothetical protein
MAIFRDSTPDSPMYREGPQSYAPHWARPFRPNHALAVAVAAVEEQLRASRRAAKSAAQKPPSPTPPSLRRPPKP